MPDNRDSGLDPSFIDAAWDDMQRQLDEAMPLESKSKRRIIAWWWWAAGLLLPVASLVWFTAQRDQPQLEALPIDLRGETIREEMPTPKAVAVIEEETTNTTQEEEKASEVPSASAQTNPKSSTNKTKSRKEGPSTNHLTNTTISTAQEVLPNKTEELEKLTKQNSQEHKVATSKAQKDQIPDRNWLPALLPITPLAPKNLATEDLVLGQEIIPSAGVSNWALEMGVSTYSFTEPDGLFVGLNQEWSKSNRKWSFGAGMHYRFQRLPFDSQNVSDINISKDRAATSLDSSFGMGQDPGMEAVLDTDNNVVNFASGDSVISVPINQLDLVQKLHFIDIPLYANFKARPNFHLFVGAQVSFLARAYLDITESRSTREQDLSASYNNIAGGSRVNWFANSGNTRLGANTADFQRLQLGLSTGFTYYPTAKLGLRLQYKNTLMSVYKDASIGTYDQWLGTSILWRFGGK